MKFHFFLRNNLSIIQAQPTPVTRLLLVLPIIFAILSARTAFPEEVSQTKYQLKVALVKSAFFGSNENDAAAAFKTFAKTLGRHQGYEIDITVSIFDNISELANLPEKEQPQITSTDSWAFLELEKAGWATPVTATSVGEGKIGSSYQLVVPAHSKAKTIGDLRGKNLNIFLTTNTEVGIPWLRSLLYQNNEEELESFFSDISIITDPMKTILPVFFGKRDAALIASGNLDLMTELNPQLKKMRTIAVSELMVGGITAINKNGWENPKIKQVIINSMLELHLYPAGQQLLHLFKADQIVSYKPEYMDTVRAIARILSEKNHTQ